MLLRTWDADYTAIREQYAPVVEKVWDFDSAKKMASVLIRTSDGYRLYNKASLSAHIALYNLFNTCMTPTFKLQKCGKCSAAAVPDCFDCYVAT